MSKYTIGIDYGTLSGRALLVNVNTGEEVAISTLNYSHAIMDEQLPCGTKLGMDWALQYPQDYIDVLEYTIPDVLRQSGIDAKDIVGIGVDFTACTVLPVQKDGTPLCLLKKYEDNPHAYVKLWKHHAAQDKAHKMNEIAEKKDEKWLARYGGKTSSEWMFAKLWQILDESPELYGETDFFIEAADWIVWQLTGVQKRSACTAGYKAMWHKKDGYPSRDFFAALDKRLANVVEEKLSTDVAPLGTRAGGISKRMAELTGLAEGTAVAVGVIDAHVCMPAVKITNAGKMLAIMGTSTCHMLLGDKEKLVPGICGYVEDGIMPGFIGYEAGQACVGDHFDWFVKNCVPHEYIEIAKKLNQNIHVYLQTLADRLKPGESGLLALDWWNGNRSVLVDADLTGMILGMTLQTKPEEIYRALVEATAFGTRVIVENFEDYGVPVNEFYAAGGIAEKSPFIMQIYADIIKKPVHISGSAQGPALGASIFGAVAAGKEKGGYDSVFEAAEKMGKLKEIVYLPNEYASKVYDELYLEYIKLHDYFGRKHNDVMKKLKQIKNLNLL